MFHSYLSWSFSRRIEKFKVLSLPCVPQTPPTQTATVGVKPTAGITGEKGQKTRLAEEWLIFFLVSHRNTLSCHCSLTGSTEHNYGHFPPLSKPTGRATMEDITQSAPAVKHAKANSATKQTPETRALTGSLVYWRGTSMPTQKTQRRYIFITTGHFSSFHEPL